MAGGGDLRMALFERVTKGAPRIHEMYAKFPGDQKLEHAAGQIGRNMDNQIKPHYKRH